MIKRFKRLSLDRRKYGEISFLSHRTYRIVLFFSELNSNSKEDIFILGFINIITNISFFQNQYFLFLRFSDILFRNRIVFLLQYFSIFRHEKISLRGHLFFSNVSYLVKHTFRRIKIEYCKPNLTLFASRIKKYSNY